MSKMIAEMKRTSGVFHNEILQIGSKCLVNIDDEHQYPAYIQDMQPDKGPVNVFVEVLGQRYLIGLMLVVSINLSFIYLGYIFALNYSPIANICANGVPGVRFHTTVSNRLFCRWLYRKLVAFASTAVRPLLRLHLRPRRRPRPSSRRCDSVPDAALLRAATGSVLRLRRKASETWLSQLRWTNFIAAPLPRPQPLRPPPTTNSPSPPWI